MEKDLEQTTSNLIKIVLVGPECTGKTTLAQQLAEHFQTAWVKEYLREFSQEKIDKHNKRVEYSDNYTITKNQIRLENEAIANAKRFLFCDTNFVQTMLYSELYFGQSDDFFKQYNATFRYNLYLLTDIDVPWKADGLRDAPFQREKHYNYFKKRLMELNLPFIEISGNQEQRKQKTITVARDLETAMRKGILFEDLVVFQKKRFPLNKILQQIASIENGISPVEITKPATINNGIFKFSKIEIRSKADFFDTNKNNFTIQKMVPASGAASRMFSFLTKFLNEFNPKTDTINAYINHNNAFDLGIFLAGLEKFPFYGKIQRILISDFPNYKTWSKGMYFHTFVGLLLSSNYLNFKNLPKGVIPFYKNETPIEQHLKEAFFYARTNGTTKIHFTITEEHLPVFEQTIKKVITKMGQNDFEVSFSFQKKTTDTVSLNPDKTLFRTEDGTILFRQAGHGALLENLNDLDADIVFIKNIDNINPHYFDQTILYKKALGGILIELQQQIFNFLRLLEQNISENKIQKIVRFVQEKLNSIIPEDFSQANKYEKIAFLKNKLNRPIRVCGMVKNEGNSGGGPFWVKNKNNEISLQIVELSQINTENPTQKHILENTTHFNPVDLVCGVTNYKGQKFDLRNYRDNDTGFLVEKEQNGYPILSYELPGLWNGAMSDWISVFVEVPLETFRI